MAKILLIAPFPPPMTGNAIGVALLQRSLSERHVVRVVNLSKPTHVSGIDSVGRLIAIVRVMAKILLYRRGADVIYLTLSESRAGNVRDMCMYWICWGRLDRMVVHMLGGANMQVLLARGRGWRYRMNSFFLRRVGGILVEGNTQERTFQQVADWRRITVVPNFAQEELFLSRDDIEQKFRETGPLRVLFLSNMLPGKGQRELLLCLADLEFELGREIAFDFAGACIAAEDMELLDAATKKSTHVRYHGPVSGSTKVALFQTAHVFCLPTYYAYEGQPYSIIEAYAAGCVVVTTAHSGIPDIFTDRVNGIEVTKRSVAALAFALRQMTKNREELVQIALRNRELASARFRQQKYIDSISSIFDSLSR